MEDKDIKQISAEELENVSGGDMPKLGDVEILKDKPGLGVSAAFIDKAAFIDQAEKKITPDLGLNNNLGADHIIGNDKK